MRRKPPASRLAGQALVELAIILPVTLLLLLAALDLGRVFYANITVSSAAKEAALRASTGANDGAAAAVNESRGGFVTVAAANVALAYSDGTNHCSDAAAFGATVTATVTAPFALITPYIGAIVGGQNKTLTAVATAHCEVLPPPVLAAGPTPTPAPTPTPGPGCPTVSFTATDNHNGGHPHRMSLAGSISPSSSGWTWTWSDGLTASGQNVGNYDFPASGNRTITLTVTKGACAPSLSKLVAVP